MAQLDDELKLLVKELVTMTKMVIKQMHKTKEAYLSSDPDLAEEVIHNENRINAMELSIDKECENLLALYHPLASDLRLVIASLKIISDLERIGDYAHGIASYVVDAEQAMDAEVLEEAKVSKMFDLVISMLEDIQTAIVEEDTKLARKVYRKDSKLNKINSASSEVIAKAIKNKPDTIEQALYLFSTIRKLERAGDHIKNIAEDLIFYVEVVVLRHKDSPKGDLL